MSITGAQDGDRVVGYGLAALSGGAAALSFPPVSFSFLAWFALVPLLLAIRSSSTMVAATLRGLAAGTVFCFLILQPLTSAGAWAGWALASAEEFSRLAEHRELLLRLASLGLALVGGSAWGLFAGCLHKLGRSNLLSWVYLAPALFVLIAEWARSLVSWRYQWGFLGMPAAQIGQIRPLAALGGVWILTLLAVAVNSALFVVLVHSGRHRRRAIVVLASIVSLAWLAGRVPLASAKRSGTTATVAVAQHQSEDETAYSAAGLDQTYLALIGKIGAGEVGAVDLLVLPESVGFGAVSLDGSQFDDRPTAVQHSLDDWTEEIGDRLGATDLLVVMGAETIRGGDSYNSLLLWDRSGLRGVYDKRQLVPFGEYQPPLLTGLGLAGETQFQAGDEAKVWPSRLGSLGPFICQEVLIAPLVYETTRRGAEILISGGNDGVFSSPTVAEIHAQLARLRAVETGRYVVRAMKTGVSAVITPAGDEAASADVGENAVLVATVEPRRALTPAVRWRPWPLFLSLLLVAGDLATRRLRTHDASQWTQAGRRRNAEQNKADD